jgi:putative transposase
VRNPCLARRSDLYRAEGASLTGVDFSRELPRLKRFPGYEWLGEVSSTILTQKLRFRDFAFVNVFEGRAKYPPFKKKHDAQAIRHQLGSDNQWNDYGKLSIIVLIESPGLWELCCLRAAAVLRYFEDFPALGSEIAFHNAAVLQGTN